MKLLFASLVAVLLVCFTSFSTYAQPAFYEVSNPLITTSGSFSQPTAYSPISPVKAGQKFPWYTRRDSITNTGADTFKQRISGRVNSVYVWAQATGITGTNTSCKVKCFVSADSGLGVSWVPIDSATVGATNPVFKHLVNSGYGWPYTNLMLVFTGAGTHSTWWYCGLMIR